MFWFNFVSSYVNYCKIFQYSNEDNTLCYADSCATKEQNSQCAIITYTANVYCLITSFMYFVMLLLMFLSSSYSMYCIQSFYLLGIRSCEVPLSFHQVNLGWWQLVLYLLSILHLLWNTARMCPVSGQSIG